MPSAVVAIGGNALLPPQGGAPAPKDRLRAAAAGIADLVASGYRVVVTHGNGPQVGHLLLQNEEAAGKVPPLTLDACVALTQAQIGYVLQRALRSELDRRGLAHAVVTVLTQVVVDPTDAAFATPTKPIGPSYETAKAREIARRRGWNMASDPRGGHRRLVPSPPPLEIVELEAIRELVRAQNPPTIPIVAGGGGIPVVRRDGRLEGVEAVIDKDATAALLAFALGFEDLLLLTDVPRVYLHYGRLYQEALERMTVAEAEARLSEGHFPPGSMGPKVAASVQFVKGGGRRAVIGLVEELVSIVDGRAGTAVVP